MSNFEAIKEWRVLDYGGGDGQLAQLLCAGGVDAVGWDPFHLNNHLPTGKFELIVCLRLFEHTPTPVETLMAACDYLKENEGAIFSPHWSMTQPPVRDEPLVYCATKWTYHHSHQAITGHLIQESRAGGDTFQRQLSYGI
jgi:2-polyprenyl-3-methyl-5-hydroxy-6-metoxy-1,4-benzoquinol methylase